VAIAPHRTPNLAMRKPIAQFTQSNTNAVMEETSSRTTPADALPQQRSMLTTENADSSTAPPSLKYAGKSQPKPPKQQQQPQQPTVDITNNIHSILKGKGLPASAVLTTPLSLLSSTGAADAEASIPLTEGDNHTSRDILDTAKDETSLILPSNNDSNKKTSGESTTTSRTKSKSNKNQSTSLQRRQTSKLQRWIKSWKRPSTQFRVTLVSSLVTLSLVGQLVAKIALPSTKGSLLVHLTPKVMHWISHRGFTGLAALGRTVAYGWAVWVAYPRLLDKRAKERAAKAHDRQLEQYHRHVRQLAQQASQLQHELATIDREIRSFRREIISIQATMAVSKSNDSTGGSDDDRIQQAIADEMAHLEQLRSDIHATWVEARQAWAEAKGQAPV